MIKINFFTVSIILTTLLIVFTLKIKAQNIGINSTGATPNSSAMLDIDVSALASKKGLLIPRMTNAEKTALVTLPEAAQGLMIYQTDGLQGFYYNTSTTTTPNWSYIFSSATGAWSTSGNSGTTAGTNFIGTTDAKDFVVKTNSVEALRITTKTAFGDGGNIGINTTTPRSRLDIVDDAVPNGIRTEGINCEIVSSPATFPNSVVTGIKTTSTNQWFGGGTKWAIGVDAVGQVNGGIGVGIRSAGKNGSTSVGVMANAEGAQSVYGVIASPTSNGNGASICGFSSDIQSGFNTSSLIGFYSRMLPVGVTTNDATGLSLIVGAFANTSYGINATVQNGSTNYGAKLVTNGTGTLNYGIYSEASGATTNWAGYFVGNGYLSGNFGLGTTAINSSAKLDIFSNNSGVLLPRIALTGATDVITIPTPVTSLLIYNTASAGVSPNNVTPGYYYYNGTKWISLSGGNGGNDWSLTGNAGTTAGTNFIGTIDNIPLNFKVNNQKAGKIDQILDNTFFGYLSGNSTTNTGNVAFGNNALYSNTNGTLNTAIGRNSLHFNIDGMANTASGEGSLYNNTSGISNSAFGKTSLMSNSIGSNNTAVGFSAGVLSTGNDNIFIGSQAGNNLSSGNRNIIIGSSIDVPVATGNNQLNIGNIIFGTGIDGYGSTLSSGNIGIGTVSPAYKFDVIGTGRFSSTLKVGTYTLPASDGAAGQVLKTNGLGVLTWQADVTGTTGWNLTGNAATTPGTNFIGTTDSTILIFKVNNHIAGRIGVLHNSDGNTSFGNNSFRALTTGYYNSAFGSQALERNTSGSGNCAFGTFSLRYNISGGGNSAYGSYSLQFNTANYNSGFGTQALNYNSVGSSNVAFGNSALQQNHSGSENTALGTSSMMNFTFDPGSSFISGNVAVGYRSMYNTNPTAITNGIYNTALGYGSGITNTTGYNNTYLGANAGGAATINNSTAIGANATVNISNAIVLGTATENVGIGTSSPSAKLEIAGQIKITGGSPGAGKVLVTDATGLATWQTVAGVGGQWLLTGNSGTSSATNYIGTNDAQDFVIKTGVGGIERIRILSTGNVGIGTTTPSEKLSVLQTTDANKNVIYGYANQISSITDYQNTGVTGFGQGNGVFGASGYGYGFGVKGIGSVNSYGAIGVYASIGTSVPSINLGNYYCAVYADASSTAGITKYAGVFLNGNVGIGTATPAYQLQLSTDNAAKPGTGAWTIASDARLKKDISLFTDGLNVLLQINPVKYKYNGLAGMPTENENIGIIAQEIQKVAPYTVGTFMYSEINSGDRNSIKKETEYLSFNSHALTFVTINAIKEQQKQIEDLKAIVTEQQKQINQLLKN